MRQFSAALLTRAMGTVKALFSSPCGRHATTAERRRRSTRIRRYTPAPAAPSPAFTTVGTTSTATAATAVPQLAPPRETFRAEDISVVRPYFEAHERERRHAHERARERAHERELSRIQAEATARLHVWTIGASTPQSAPTRFDDLVHAWELPQGVAV